MTKPASATTNRAVTYARYSTEFQKPSSITNQQAMMHDVAKRESLVIVREFGDPEKSGRFMRNRTGLGDMMEAARRREFDVLIIEAIDRLSRDQAHAPTMFKRLAYWGIRVYSLADGWIKDRWQIGIRSIGAEMEVESRSRQVRRAHIVESRAGRVLGAVTYGYRRILGKPGDREIDPDQAKVIVRIFELYADGVSPRAIAAALNRDGIASPKGTLWNHQAFVGGRHQRGMISNPIYRGHLVWCAMRRVIDPDEDKERKRPAPDDEITRVDVPHLRIVDQSLWDRAQAVRTGRALQKFGPTGRVARRPVIARNSHMLAGLLQCGACGGHMRISNTSRGGGARIACASAHQHDACKHSKTYDLNQLTGEVIADLRDRLNDPALLDEWDREFEKTASAELRTARVEHDKHRKKLTGVNASIDAMVRALEKGSMPEAAIHKALQRLEAERASLDDLVKLGNANAANVIVLPAARAQIRREFDRLRDGLGAVELEPETRSALRTLVQAIVISPTPKRHPYAWKALGRFEAITGALALFPERRSASQIVEEYGAFACSDIGNPGKPGPTLSQQPTGPAIVLAWSRERRAA